MTRPRLAMFDMDRTLLSKETATLYVKYERDIGEASTRDLARTMYWVAQYTLGILDAEKIGRRALAKLEGVPELVIAARCDDWFERRVERFITDGGREAVRRHQERGDVVAIVTGASVYASRPLARLLGVEHLVSSVFEVDPDGYFTGRPVDPFCFGVGKLERARRLAEEVGLPLEEGVFYTDSISDLPLLEVVAEPVAVSPDPRLTRIAKQRGYRIERW
ncbi:MAG TPA: HAD family phosphatase [Polyangiaceae bacterium]|jgi:HAD superfamily hydrolase (TIGR01490 family)|nr:HAD family phosphatase [Polyangiaceae bacterium]